MALVYIWSQNGILLISVSRMSDYIQAVLFCLLRMLDLSSSYLNYFHLLSTYIWSLDDYRIISKQNRRVGYWLKFSLSVSKLEPQDNFHCGMCGFVVYVLSFI